MSEDRTPPTEPMHRAAAAYVLGALQSDDRSEFLSHLESCSECQRDVLDFSPLPGLLAHVRPDDLEFRPPTDTADLAVRKLQTERESLDASLRRWRLAALSLVAAAVLIAGFVLLTPADEEPVFGGPLQQLALDPTTGVTGTIAVSERDWGTRLEIDLFDMPERDSYALWTVSADGSWDLAGTWGWAESGTCRVVGASPVDTDELTRVVVTSNDKSDELVSAAWRS